MFSANSTRRSVGIVARVLLLVLAGCSRLESPGPAPAEGTGPGGEFEGSAAALHAVAGLVSAVPDSDAILVSWRSLGLDELAVGLRVYVTDGSDELLDGSFRQLPSLSSSLLIDGLEEDTEYELSLALSSEVGGAYVLTGPALTARTGDPFFADPNADGAGADGLTPETAYPNLFIAALTASLAGGGNVWIAEGTFQGVSIPLFENVHLYGGFSSDFDLESRDPSEFRTELRGLSGSSVLILEAGGSLQRVDGLAIDGGNVAANGIDLDRTPAQLTALEIEHCGRGLRLRAPLFVTGTRVDLVAITSANNQLEGLSLEGPYSLLIDGCRFEHNGQEGVEFGPWIAPAGQRVSARVSDSSFSGNGLEGLDMDLAAPATSGAGGRFELDIEDCNFEGNGGSGCLVDLDYESSPTWSAGLRLRGSFARGNAGSGFSFDLDSSFDGVVHRVLSTANGADGLSVTSESHAGSLTVSAGAFVGNAGFGVRGSLGNVGLALSHCVLSGNAFGGLRSDVTSATATSSVAHAQPNAFPTSRLAGSLDLPGTPLPFRNAPIEFRRVQSISGAELVLDAPIASAVGSACEFASDAVERRLDGVTGNRAVVTPLPSTSALPTILAVFSGSSSVQEDYRPGPASALIGSGLMLPDGAAIDAGPFGSPAGGAPGAQDLAPGTLFFLASSTPAWGVAPAPDSPVRLRFAGGTPSNSSVSSGVRVVDAVGSAWPLDAELQQGELIVHPPAGGWAAGDCIELHSSLRSTEQTSLLPITFPVGPLHP